MFFGKLVQTEWLSQISLSKKREAEIQSCFDCPIEFHYRNNQDDFDSLLEEFKLKTGKVCCDGSKRISVEFVFRNFVSVQ